MEVTILNGPLLAVPQLHLVSVIRIAARQSSHRSPEQPLQVNYDAGAVVLSLALVVPFCGCVENLAVAVGLRVVIFPGKARLFRFRATRFFRLRFFRVTLFQLFGVHKLERCAVHAET